MKKSLFDYLDSLSPEKLGRYFRDNHFYSKRLKIDHLSFSDKMRWLSMKWYKDPWLYEIRVFLAVLSYTLHDYERAERLIKRINKSRIQFKSFIPFKKYFSDTYLKRKQKHQIANLTNFKNLRILILRCESNQTTEYFQWQDDLYEALKKTNVKGEDKDLLKSNFLYLNFIDQFYTSHFKSLENLFSNVEDNYDIIIVVGHGSSEEIEISLKEAKNIIARKFPLEIFFQHLNSSFSKQTNLIFFPCNGSKVIELSNFEKTVTTTDEVHFEHMIPFSFSFLSSTIFGDSFDIAFERAMLFTSLFHSEPNRIIRN